jgi:hypothetical protein
MLILNTNDLLTKSEIIEFYKHIAEQQSYNYTNLITVILGLSVLLVGSTWFWNFVLAKKQINSEITSQYHIKKINLKLSFLNLLKINSMA